MHVVKVMAVGALVLSGAVWSGGVAHAEKWKRIKTQDQLVAAMAGKEFRDDTGAWEIRADGKMVGQFGGDKLQGAWKWDRKAWCRSYVFKGKEKPTECQHMWISGDKVRFRKDRGKGAEGVEVLVAK